jgi:hypothetical protein
MGRSKKAPGVSNRRRSSGKKSIAEDISVDDLLAQEAETERTNTTTATKRSRES